MKIPIGITVITSVFTLLLGPAALSPPVRAQDDSGGLAPKPAAIPEEGDAGDASEEKGPAPATGDMESLLREALFAEEVDRDPERASRAYAEVLRQFDDSRQVAATAAYRLAEVSRQLSEDQPDSKYRELAVRHYERVIREFADLEALADLSRKELLAMGRTPPGAAETAPADEEAQRIRQLETWRTTSPDRLAELPTPLFQAAGANELLVADYLIGAGVDLERGDGGITPLSAAARAGHLAMVEKLLAAGADPRPATGLPPIHLALRYDRLAVVQSLVAVGAHLDAPDSSGHSPLFAVVSGLKRRDSGPPALPTSRRLEYAALLAEAGADLDEPNPSNGETPLIGAVRDRSSGMVTWLLEQGADVNAPRDRDGVATPLTLAIQAGDLELAARLLEAGADVNRADDRGIAPLHHALVRDADSAFVERLLGLGADPNLATGGNSPWTALHLWAALSKDDELGRTLLRAGGDPLVSAEGRPRHLNVGYVGGNSHTPLTILSGKRDRGSTIVREFLESGLRSLPSRDFAEAVWFAMPRRSLLLGGEAHSVPSNNLIPVFERQMANSAPPNLAMLVVDEFKSVGRHNRRISPPQPDLETVRILRPDPAPGDAGAWTVVAVPYAEIAVAGNPGADPALCWGDIVLFDGEADQSDGNAWSWERFPAPVSTYLRQAASVSVRLTLGDQSEETTIIPAKASTVSVVGHELRQWDFAPGDVANLLETMNWREDLDLSTAIVRRSLGGEPVEFALDLEQVGKGGSFFLCDGDEVIVPYREGHDRMAPANRSQHIWVARPGTHLLRPVADLRRFRLRPVEGLPLSRVVGLCFSDPLREPLALPFPDFERLRIDGPDLGVGSGRTVSLEEAPDTLVPWGAIVQIPMVEGADAASWTGFSDEEIAMLTKASSVTVTVEAEGMEPRQMEAGFTFPKVFRSDATGELHRVPGSPSRQPQFWSLFSEEIRGEDSQWDRRRVVLETRDGRSIQVGNAPGDMAPLFDGDVVKLFRRL